MELVDLLFFVVPFFSNFATATSRWSPHPPSHGHASPILVSASSAGASKPLPESFVAFSIEFAFFPDFAGNQSAPNTFSNNLLDNIGAIQGVKPYIRVGGNTQDYALYNGSLRTATYGVVIPSKSTDYPYILYIGPSFFESYDTWPNTRFSHGFNLGKNGTAGRETLLATAALACKALGKDKLYYWELGNEPDLFKTSAQGPVRPSTWTETDYVRDWQNGTAAIEAVFKRECPELTGNSRNRWLAPSFAGISNSLSPVKTWADGLDSRSDVAFNSEHNYIGGATQPGVTLQGTLMNHTNTVQSVQQHVALKNSLTAVGVDVPYILGETNSLYNEGAPGLSNSFGAALWGVDFNLYCASMGIERVHMHQGTDYRYASWQPIDTNKTTKGTKAPYYGNIAVASVIGDLTDSKVSIQNLPLGSETDAAYAAYENGKLVRLMVINMVEYNYSVPDPGTRPSQTYSFKLPIGCRGEVATAQYLAANGSDAITGISFGGVSYNFELNGGRPVALGNVTESERLYVKRGLLEVTVPYSGAALVSLDY